MEKSDQTTDKDAPLRYAFLGAHRFAEDTAEKPYVDQVFGIIDL